LIGKKYTTERRMQMSVKVEVWGEYALFSRPELKAERYSYDVMTPSAARGLLEAILLAPGACTGIDRQNLCSEPHRIHRHPAQRA
jgi:CRISPR-associated Cas5-like protein